MTHPHRALLILALLASVALAGCASSTGGASTSNFQITPERVGWNVGDEARFTLSIRSTTFSKTPEYTVDPDFAIAEVAFEQRGASVRGDFRTRDSSEIGLRLWRDGVEVEEATLDLGNASVDLTLTVPAKLRDAEYVLELQLFKVGFVRSDPFRVNVP